MYDKDITRATPACIVFLVDRSDSMGRGWAGSGTTLAEGAARAINRIIYELCIKCTKEVGAPLRNYFYVGIYGYGLCPRSGGGEGVESALPGQLATRGIVPLPELADQPIAIREQPSVDDMGPSSRMPVWYEAAHGYRTPMCAAMAIAGEHVYQWSQAFPDSFPPIVCNVTDGQVTDSPYQNVDLAGWASRLSTISTRNGQALVLNAFLSADKAPTTSFPSHPNGLPAPGPQLFSISSTLPEPMVRNARAENISVDPGARGLVFNADLATLVKFLEIGTRVVVGND